MSRKDEGHYKAKHGEETAVDSRLAEQIQAKQDEGGLSCIVACEISNQLGLPMAQVGRAADLAEVKLARCQLGLFGYGSGRSKHPDFGAMDQVSPELEQAIQGALKEGQLSCIAAWSVAGKQGVARLEVARACERLGIRIKTCQLGAF